MNFLQAIKTHYPKVVLTIIPIAIMLITIHLAHISGLYSTRSGDPEFIFLFNGALLGDFHLNVPHIDNPGTPLQIIAAITTRITHLFTGDSEYMEDILINPDKYLTVISVSLNFLIAFFSLLIGIKIFKLTKNILLSLLVQIAPFCSTPVFLGLSRILPDAYMWIALILLTYMVIKYYYDPDSESNLTRYAITMGLICALALSFKFDAVSYYIIPLFMLPSYRSKLIFLGTGFFSFFIFAFPVLFDLNFIYFWIKGIITHTGRYGRGSEGFIDSSSFAGNLSEIFNFYPGFKIILILLAVALIFSFVYKQKENRKLSFTLLGVFLSMTFHAFMVSKHFALHYMFSVIAITPLAVFLIGESFGKLWVHFNRIIIGLALCIIVFTFYKNYTSVIPWKKEITANKAETIKEVENIVGNNTFIIVPRLYKVYFKDQGLLFGTFFTGKFRPQFQASLDRLYPNRYVYDLKGIFFRSGEVIPPEEVLKPEEDAYIFFSKEVLDKSEKVIGLLGDNLQLEKVYTHDKTGDVLMKVSLMETK
jgi:hypothetical protein